MSLSKLKNYLKENKIDGILISSVPHIAYLTDFFNFATEERDAYLLITRNFNYLITSTLYAQAFRNRKWEFKLVEISARFKSKEALEKIRNDEKIKSLSIEEDDIRVREYKSLKKIFKKLSPFNFPHFRSIKTPEEITQIEKACQIGDKVFSEILIKIKPGVAEKEIALQFKMLALKKGADDISFSTIVAFDKNSAVPHHGSGNQKLGEGQIILMDFGMKVNGYCSDITRTVFLGKASDKQKKLYNGVLKSQENAAEYIKACLKEGKSVLASEVDKIARESVKLSGYKDIPHSLGHGVGLEVHEHPHLGPASKDELTEGMVFSIEPGIYIPNFGGVRIEDLYVIEGNKLRQLTTAPKSLIEL